MEVQFNLRIPVELKEQVREAAKISGRSINAEAQYRLEESFNKKQAHESEMSLMMQVISDQQRQLDQLQEMVKQLIVRPREIQD